MLKRAVRSVLDGFGAAFRTSPALPMRVGAPTTLNHGALVRAVQAQSAGETLTLTVTSPAEGAIGERGGSILIEHERPPCVTGTGVPATTMDAIRESTDAFDRTRYDTDVTLTAVIWIQDALLTAIHACGALTVIVPVLPSACTDTSRADKTAPPVG
jgi:hypothetical protein